MDKALARMRLRDFGRLADLQYAGAAVGGRSVGRHWLSMFGRLGELYWWLRYERRVNARRTYWYRLILLERARITLEVGDAELVRLYCRHLANPERASTYERFMRCAVQGGFVEGPAWG